MSSPINGVAESNINESAHGANVAHRGETRFEHDAGIGHRLQRVLRGGLSEHIHIQGILRAAGDVGVTVDKTRKHGHLAEIDNFGTRRNGYIVADCLDLASTDHDRLADENRAGVRIDKLTGTNSSNLGGGGNKQPATDRHKSQTSAHGKSHGH